MTTDTKGATKIDVELSKLNKAELKLLCVTLGTRSHNRKDVMINRLRLDKESGALVSPFDEGEFDADLELKYAAKEKAKKEPKPEINYKWQDSTYAGRQVYTSAGTGNILKESGEDVEGGYFLIKLISDGTERVVNENTTRFKAVADGYRDKYIKDDSVRTESGAPSIHSGSEVSFALLGSTSGEVGSVYKENGLEDLYKQKVEANRNHGMRRMDLGNILTARIRRGEDVSVFGEFDMKHASEKGQARAAKEAAATLERKATAKKIKTAEIDRAKAEKATAKEKTKVARETAALAKKADKAEKAKAKKAPKQAKVTKKAA